MASEQEAFKILDQPDPFIGHPGFGSRVVLQDKDGVFVVKESLFGQLLVIFGLLLFGPGLTFMAFVHPDRVSKNPPFILAVVGFFSLIGWIFGFKYLYRLLGGRRVEIRAADGAIELYEFGRTPSRRIERSQVQRIENYKTIYRTNRGAEVDNFSLRLTLTNGERVDLCTSNMSTQIDAIRSQLRTIFGDKV